VRPEDVKLNNMQKAKAMAKAIDSEIPWQIIFVVASGLIFATMTGIALPTLFVNWLGNAVCVVIISLLSGTFAGLAVMLILVFMEDKIMPLYRSIMQQYDREALIIKKDVLDNVIEDEILNK
jgi:formate-dependent nitrite reductase membrane component NrfD